MSSLPKEKSETPEEHVHESVGRQAKAAKNVASTARKVAKKADDKAAILAKATDLLSNRVGALADAVQINNIKIDRLRDEVNQKPDDVEVKLITGLAEAERGKHFRYALATSILSAVIAGVVAFSFANYNSSKANQERTQTGYEACMAYNERTALTTKVFRDVAASLPDGEPKTRIVAGAEVIDGTIRDCDTIYPKEER